MIFPDQTVSEKERNANDRQWYKDHFTYVDSIFTSFGSRVNRIDKLYNNYHGKYAKKKHDEFLKRYAQGDKNVSKTKFIDYKLATGKIERLVGEFLKREIRPSVITLNKDAVTKKLTKMSRNLALMAAKDEVEKLRASGVDVYGGMPILDKNQKDFKERLNPKTQNEKYMTLVLQEQIKRLRLKEIGGQTLQDCCIASECHAHVYIGRNKKVMVERIHPRNVVFEELEGDQFLEKSGIVGFRVESTIQQSLQNHGYKLTEEEKKTLREVANNQEDWTSNGMKYVENNNGRLIVWEQQLYWYSTKKIREKYTKGKNNEFIPYYQKILSEEYYEENKEKIKKDVEAGKYQVREGYLVTIYQARRIAKDIYIDTQEQKYIIRRSDDPTSVFYNYTGLLINSLDGERMSIMEKMQDLSDLYNVIMWQMRREIARFKGNVLVYDKAFLQAGQSLNDVYYGLSEEGIVTVNSNAEENQSSQNLDRAGVSSVNIGEIGNINGLIGVKIDIQNMLDRISGINEFREGIAPSSSTATQNIEAIAASRTITSPIFYAHSKFLENVFMRVIELTKYSIGVLGDESFDAIIGDVGNEVIKKSADIPYDEYGTFLIDPNKEAEIRERITLYGNAAINAKQLDIGDMLDAELAPTIQDAVMLFKEGRERAVKIQEEQQKMMLESQERNVQANTDLQDRAREDAQQHDKDMAILEAELESGLTSQKSKDQAAIQQQQQNQK